MKLIKCVFECREISETDRNKECPVTMELINIDEKYCRCSQCEYNIKENVIKTMFDKTNNVKCPMCRLQWQKKIVYFNSNKHNTFIIEEKYNKPNTINKSSIYSFAASPEEWAPADANLVTHINHMNSSHYGF